MDHDGPNWLIKARRTALILSAALLPLIAFAGSEVRAQSVMRTPNLNVGSRVPTINPVAPRIAPNIAARPDVGVIARTRTDLGGRSTLSVARFPTNSGSACQNAGRDANGECLVQSTDGGKGARRGGSAKKLARKGKGGSDKGISQAAVNLRPSRTNSSPKSTARCPWRKPMNWRGVMVWSASLRKISR